MTEKLPPPTKFIIQTEVFQAGGDTSTAELCIHCDTEEISFRQYFEKFFWMQLDFSTPHQAFLFYRDQYIKVNEEDLDGIPYFYECFEEKGPAGNYPVFKIWCREGFDSKYCVANIVPLHWNDYFI